MGYGAVTANYRLDGRTVPSMIGGERIDTRPDEARPDARRRRRIGVNASTMPGVKIGAGAIIGAEPARYPRRAGRRARPGRERVWTLLAGQASPSLPLCLVLVVFVAAAEAGLISISRARVRLMAGQGVPRADILHSYMQERDRCCTRSAWRATSPSSPRPRSP